MVARGGECHEHRGATGDNSRHRRATLRNREGRADRAHTRVMAADWATRGVRVNAIAAPAASSPTRTNAGSRRNRNFSVLLRVIFDGAAR